MQESRRGSNVRVYVPSRKADDMRQNSSATMERRAGRTEFLAVNVKNRDALHGTRF
jgi:hypothetical protein